MIIKATPREEITKIMMRVILLKIKAGIFSGLEKLLIAQEKKEVNTEMAKMIETTIEDEKVHQLWKSMTEEAMSLLNM